MDPRDLAHNEFNSELNKALPRFNKAEFGIDIHAKLQI
jgi:hypothetical protein